jgi:hypothetical protein
MYQVTMECPSCGQEWIKTVYGVDNLEAALQDPVDICPDCEHGATLMTEEEYNELLPF